MTSVGGRAEIFMFLTFDIFLLRHGGEENSLIGCGSCVKTRAQV